MGSGEGGRTTAIDDGTSFVYSSIDNVEMDLQVDLQAFAYKHSKSNANTPSLRILAYNTLKTYSKNLN